MLWIPKAAGAAMGATGTNHDVGLANNVPGVARGPRTTKTRSGRRSIPE